MQKLLALSQPDYQVKILDEVDTQVEKDPVLAASWVSLYAPSRPVSFLFLSQG